MVAEENWSKFHDKFASDNFRRSSSYDDGHDSRGIGSKIKKILPSRKSLVKSISSSKLSPSSGLQRSGSSKGLSASVCSMRQSLNARSEHGSLNARSEHGSRNATW